MSGGTIHPSHFSVRDIAISIRENSVEPGHAVFAAHLDKVADAVRALDLELSNDTGPGDATPLIQACLNDADLLVYPAP